jgi:hypothetical protein
MKREFGSEHSHDQIRSLERKGPEVLEAIKEACAV